MKNKKYLFLAVLIVVAIMTLTFTACEKAEDALNKFIAPAPENIRYDGNIITWDKTSADYYYISINEGAKTRVNTNSYAYATESSFNVSVYAVYSDKENSSSATFNPLAPISTLYVDDNGTVRWDAVSGAGAYSVSVNGTVTEVTETSFSFLKVGSNVVKVKPIVSGDPSYFSKWTQEKQISICAAPTSVKYDGATITWAGNASNYEVIVNGASTVVNKREFDYNSENKDFSVEIKGIGNHTTTFDSAVTTEEFKYLDAVTNISVVDGNLHWDPVDGAKGYKLRVDGVISKDSVVGATTYEKLASGRSIRMSLLAYNDEGNYFSSWSAEKTIFLLEAPTPQWNTSLELDGEANNNYVWDAVNGANGYTVSVTKNGETTSTVLAEVYRAFAHDYKEVGVYTVKVKANAPTNNPDYYDSKYSVETTVERLASPKAATKNFIVSDPSDLGKGFTVNYVPVNGAKGYQLYKDGVLVSGKYSTASAITDTNVSSDKVASEQKYTYVVRSMGDVKVSSGKTYVRLPSLTESSLSFDITVQAVPTNIYMDGFYVKWDSVVGNNGYAVGYAGQEVIAQSENHDMSTIAPGTYDVKVCTRGNGEGALASAFSAGLTVKRLSAPTGIRIDAGEGNGLLSYNTISDAKSYSVFLDLSDTSIDENARQNMYDYVTEQGTLISMTSNANYYNGDKTIYYMTSPISPTYQFIRLSSPTFPEGALSSQKELMWSAPKNINTNEYTPTYTVFQSDVAMSGQYNSTKFNLTTLEGGKDYSFSVKAVGNGTKYLDSKVSKTLSFHKIATPTLIVDGNGYSWNSVTNSSAYVLEIDGVKVNDNIHVAGNYYTFMPYYNKIGSHSVKLYAIGDGVNTVQSEPTSYNQTVEALQAPEIKSYYDHDVFTTGGKIFAEIIKQTPHAKNYQYEIAGAAITSDKTSASQIIASAGSYTIKVKAAGGVIEDGIYYIDSQYTAEQNIHLLPAPTKNSFAITADGVIKWANVSGSVGYDYCIVFDLDEEFSDADIKHTGYTSIAIENYNSYRYIKIRVRASSNGSPNKVNSEWVEWTWTNPNI